MNWINQPTWKNNITYTVLLIYVVDPATFLASNSVQGTLFSSENSLFTQLWRR